MISELKFSRGYSSFWKKTFPFLSRVVRKVNLEKNQYVDSLNSTVEAKRRALVNEAGYRIFEYINSEGLKKESETPKKVLQEIKKSTLNYISNLEKNKKGSKIKGYSENEFEESFQISNNLRDYFKYHEPSKEVVTSPSFKGCGILNSCFGDVLCGKTLYEIKSGDREFRISDLRQTLTYAALASLDDSTSLEEIGLINPRHGIYSLVSIKDIVDISSGRGVQDAYLEIINFLDSPHDFT